MLLGLPSRTPQSVPLWIILTLLAAASLAHASPAPSFDREIRPILSENCFPCHGADSNKRKAGLRLDIPNGTTNELVVALGRPEKSLLIKHIFTTDEDDLMPPPSSKKHLTDAQRQLLRSWILNGAKYEKHWSFEPPVKPPLPSVKQKKWPKNAIDYFVLNRVEREGLLPTSPQALAPLLRRVSLDLTGLPPSPARMKRWLSQPNPYGTVVEELLADPAYGERMASDWMDMARYSDTHGFNNDSQRTMWRWRDWVIDAFNQNLTYDRFLTEQLAGDLLKNPTLEQLIATGFNRNHVINSEGGIVDEEYRVEYVADRVQTTSMAWMGLTMGCARCHDHKFDPVTQKDFYRMYAFFNSNDECGEDGRVGNAAPFISAPTAAQQKAIVAEREKIRRTEKTMREIETKERAAVSAANFAAIFKPEESKSVADASTNVVFWLQGRPVDTDVSLVTNQPTGFSSNALAVVLNATVPSNHVIGLTSTGGIGFSIGPLKTAAVVFSGEGLLKSGALPRFDAGKGWAFSSWFRRDTPVEGVLFSTMNFSVPPSSESYGKGAEIRLTQSGEVEVRLARRWPAYSINTVTREQFAPGEWRHLLVVCDGSTLARGVRVFVDGRECSQAVLHDNFPEVGISGTALLGGSRETNAPAFVGALADTRLLARPGSAETLAESSRQAALRFAWETRESERRTDQSAQLRQARLERSDSDYAAAATAARSAHAAILKFERDASATMVMRELPQPRITHLLFRGQYDLPREAVEPGVPDFLLPFPKDAPKDRLGLAQWLTSPRNPLTSRVVVNRLWMSLFGTGLVQSVEDFGYQGDWPSHPELLDWLAVEFVESGWDLKHLIRLIVSSATYCQDSKASTKLNERDPENRLLARGPRQRLTAEMLRDQALALSGLLVQEVGGPPVFPYQPSNLYSNIVVAADYPGTHYTESTGPELYRRSLYTFWKRTVPQPTLATFDAPDREVCTARRLRTDTPLQALALMNDTIQLECSRKLAERMMREGGTSLGPRLNFAFELATARAPASAERKALSSLFEKRLDWYREHPDSAKALLAVGASPVDPKLNPVELAAYANVASLILNLDETINRN